MKLRAAALALIIMALLAAPVLAVNYESADGTLKLSAGRIDIGTNRLVAVGNAHIHYFDSIKKTTMDADAAKILVTTMQQQPVAPKATVKGAKAPRATTAVKTAVLSGPVKMIYITVDSSGKATITANADNADYDGITNLAHLTGDVKIVNDNPTLFSAPATMSGDVATLNLKPSGPDDFRFRVESSPGTAAVTVTPKPQKQGEKAQ